jgi:arginyl-tRNA synthetase
MLPAQKQQLAALIEQALAGLGAPPLSVPLERPKVAAHGDLACNVALQAAKALKKNPREVAQAIAAALRVNPAATGLVDAVEVAGPGFINLRLAAAAKLTVVRQVLRERQCFGTSSAHAGERVMVEFVSANPTGPLHLGHARQGALGDALANLLAAQGWQVTREFYYNDAGVQIDKLAISVQARARELQGQAIEFPEDGYRGEYIVDIARAFLAGETQTSRDGRAVRASGNADDLANLRDFAVACLRHEQDMDLAAFGVAFDHFYLESSLYTDGKVEAAVRALVASGKTFEADGALWLRTTEIADIAGDGGPAADDKDRVMRKSDGTYTYFVPDVAYHLAKLQRGYHLVIDVQGSDHYGTVARVRAGVRAAAPVLGIDAPAGFPSYLLHKMVRVMRAGARPAGLGRARRGAVFSRLAQGGYRVRVRRGLGALAKRGQPRVLRAVRACADLLGAGAGRGRGRDARRGRGAACVAGAVERRQGTGARRAAGGVSGTSARGGGTNGPTPGRVLPEGPRGGLSR